MIFGIGTDIVSVERIDNIFKKYGLVFAKRILTDYEYQYFQQKRKCSTTYLASRFAIKESVSKALGTGIGKISFHGIETKHTEQGKPVVSLNGYAKQFQNEQGITCIHISISDEDKYVVGFAIAEK